MRLWFWRPETREADLDEELRTHLDMARQARLERGASQREAERASRREFGNLDLVKETVRDQWGRRSAEELVQDLRFGLRSFLRNPGFTAVAVLTLALGIGANTAIFSAVNSVLLRPLPFRDPNRLVRVFSNRGTAALLPVSGEDYFDWESQNHSFEDISLFSSPQNFNAGGEPEPETVSVVSAQANFFSVIGVAPKFGRAFAEGEDRPSNHDVALLSFRFWQRHFGGQLEAIGKTVSLNFEKYTVVGILPPTFNYPESVDVWIPAQMEVDRLGRRGNYSYRVLARLKPGVTIAQAQADMATVTKSLAAEYPVTNSTLGAQVVSLKELLTGDSRPQLLVLLGAVALVLLVACANVANLLLARATVRQREIALRATLGASRGRLVRQLLTESVTLSSAGATLGLAGAWWLVEMAQSAKSLPVPRESPIRIDGTVLLFTVGISMLVGMVFGLAPALQSSRLNLHDELKASAGAVAGGPGRRLALRDVLVVAEIATSLALLAGAGLLLRSFAEMRRADLGVRTQNILTSAVVLPEAKYKSIAERKEFYERLLERVEHVSGVKAAALSQQIPLEGSHVGTAKREGDTDPRENGFSVNWNYVTPDYFRVLGIPFLSGRNFTPQELDRAAVVGIRVYDYWESGGKVVTGTQPQWSTSAIINHAMAQALWPGQDAVGKVFLNAVVQPVTVVGVVGDEKYNGIREPAAPEVYFPVTEELTNKWYPPNIVVETERTPESVIRGIRTAVRELDSELAVFRVRTMQQVISDNMQDTTLQTILLGSFALLGLLLSAVGIYGVMAYLVTQRTHEIGLRVALGAQQRDILHLVIGRGSRLALAGVASGVFLAFALSRLLSKELFGVTATDPVTFLAVSVLLTAVAQAACYLPAHRAMRLDPLTALRYE